MGRLGKQSTDGTGDPLQAIGARLRSERVVDLGNYLAQPGRNAVRTAVRRWDERGRLAYVLLLGPDNDLTAWRRLWDTLRLSPDLELLLLYDGQRWEARGWGRSAQEISALLEAQEATLLSDRGAGLAAALDALGSGMAAPPAVASPAAESDASEEGVGIGWLLGTSGLAILAGTAFVIRRRMRRAREDRDELETALASADATYAQVTLAADELDEAVATPFQLRAAELRDRLKDVHEASLAAGVSRVTLGRISQIEDELRALYSQVLQAGEATQTASAPDVAPSDQSTRR